MKNKIESLLNTYSHTSAKRIAKIKKQEANFAAQKLRKEKFIRDFKNTIAAEVRPFMKKLMASVQNHFICKADSAHIDSHLTEQYSVKSKTEKDIDFYIALRIEPHENNKQKVMLCTCWAVDIETDNNDVKEYALHEINKTLLENTFISLLEKVSE